MTSNDKFWQNDLEKHNQKLGKSSMVNIIHSEWYGIVGRHKFEYERPYCKFVSPTQNGLKFFDP